MLLIDYEFDFSARVRGPSQVIYELERYGSKPPIVVSLRHMTSIDKELAAAKEAKAVISTLSATTRPSLAPLHYAIAVLHLSDEGPLDEARKDAGIALSALIHSRPTPEKIDKAKSAVEEWIKQLRT